MTEATDLRVECMKMAINSLPYTTKDCSLAMAAGLIYDWITKPVDKIKSDYAYAEGKIKWSKPKTISCELTKSSTLLLHISISDKGQLKIIRAAIKKKNSLQTLYF